MPSSQPVDQPSAQNEASKKATVEPSEIAPIVLPADPAGDEHDGDAAGESDSDAENQLLWGDGIAQWVMAISGVLALLLSAWAVWLLARTLEATRSAVKAADDAVTVTRDIGQAQVRAYIAVGDLRVDKFAIGMVPVVSFTIKNVGQSPARRFQIVTRVLRDRGPFPTKLRFSGEKWDGMRIDIPAGGTSSQETELSLLNSGIYEEFRSSQRTLTAFGLIRYRTVFGKRCYCVFRGYLDMDDLRDGSAKLTPTRKHNRSS
ncbi:MAG: hypothetical protein OSA96_00045 [Aurantimonas coralicida]|nr:hypothetical protein [Aurantimonas coralicida]